MLKFDIAQDRFNYRVATVTIHHGAVLLQGSPNFDYWVLPGGRAEMMETALYTAQRELREELNLDAQVGRLLWIVENFFAGDGGVTGHRQHELSLIFETTLPNDWSHLSTSGNFPANEDGVDLYFRWQPLATLTADLVLYPEFLQEWLMQPLPKYPVHIVNDTLGVPGG